MKEKDIEVNGKIFSVGKLDAFDQQYVFGKLIRVFSEFGRVFREEKSEEKAIYTLQEGFASLGRETYKEVSTLLLSKVSYKQKVNDGVSNLPVKVMTESGGFQFDWLEYDMVLFQQLLIQAFQFNYESFLVSQGS